MTSISSNPFSASIGSNKTAACESFRQHYEPQVLKAYVRLVLYTYKADLGRYVGESIRLTPTHHQRNLLALATASRPYHQLKPPGQRSALPQHPIQLLQRPHKSSRVGQ